MIYTFVPCFQQFQILKWRKVAHYLPISAFEPMAQPKRRLRPLLKHIKSELMGSTKIFQKFKTKVLALSMRPG